MLSCVWGDIMKKIDVNELVLKQGFGVFIQISSQKNDNLIGYVWVENTDVNANKRIVIDQDKLNEAGLEKKVLLSLLHCFSPFLLSIIRQC